MGRPAIRQAAEAPLLHPHRLGQPTFQVDLVIPPGRLPVVGASARQAGIGQPPNLEGEGLFRRGSNFQQAVAPAP